MTRKKIIFFTVVFLMLSLTIFGKKNKEALAEFSEMRKTMVESQMKQRGIKDKRVLDAMLKVERHRFVPDFLAEEAYNDYPLPIGEGQTISQPYIVALMTELLKLKGDEKVLEIGTGSGYQAAVLSLLCRKVYSVEIICSLADTAGKRLKELGYTNVNVFCRDGYLGLKEHAPFDRIIVTCAPPYVPQPLIDQLKEGGLMVIPVGEFDQDLKVLKKIKGKMKEETIVPVRFVVMTGKNIQGEIDLPQPSFRGTMSVEEALNKRHSIREFRKMPLSLKEVSQLLWSANGISEVDAVTGATKTAPSAGGLYPFSTFFIAFQVESLEKGLYVYVPEKNMLKLMVRADLQKSLALACYGQDVFLSAAAVIVYTCDYDKVKKRYGERGAVRYAHMDIGHSAENVYLQAEALGIGTVAVGAFDDRKVEEVLDLKGKNVLYLLPLGKKK